MNANAEKALEYVKKFKPVEPEWLGQVIKIIEQIPENPDPLDLGNVLPRLVADHFRFMHFMTCKMTPVLDDLVKAVRYRLGSPGPCHCDLDVGAVCEDCHLWEKMGNAEKLVEKK